MAISAGHDDIIEVSYSDNVRLASEVCAAGPSAMVLEPDEVMRSVCDSLDAIIAAHEPTP
jgi:hypothetical protein